MNRSEIFGKGSSRSRINLLGKEATKNILILSSSSNKNTNNNNRRRRMTREDYNCHLCGWIPIISGSSYELSLLRHHKQAHSKQQEAPSKIIVNDTNDTEKLKNFKRTSAAAAEDRREDGGVSDYLYHMHMRTIATVFISNM